MALQDKSLAAAIQLDEHRKLVWTVRLKPLEQRSIHLRYSVSYPAGETIDGI
jgi:3-polyprenyl-4-hydroxybenzoate decarboxylase